jgi:S-adenosylmethionine hydrolase
MAADPLITLTTDFGLSDAYVGAMKGVIATMCPAARVVDLTHDVEPQNVLTGAFLLETAWRYFPAGTVHVAVVDPGVGTARRRLAISADGHNFVGPDNGVLSAALADETRGTRAPGEVYERRTVRLPNSVTAVSIDNEVLMRPSLSATFEGRDVFAPAAAYLAGGGAIGELGPVVDAVEALPAFRAVATLAGIEGRILHVDRFGNLITDIRAADLPDAPVFRAGGRTIEGISHTYESSNGIAAIVGSSGFVELAQSRGQASQVLGLGQGDRVRVI